MQIYTAHLFIKTQMRWSH